MLNSNVNAIIWDYDGTLVDTLHKNLNVTRSIIESIIEKDATSFPALQSPKNYYLANRRTLNWRDFYRSEFNLSETQIDKAGQLWTPYQMRDDTDVTLYDGMEGVIRELADFPHGIVSQNSSNSISNVLKKHQLLSLFQHIVGYEEVALDKQKPNPDGLLSCLEELSALEPGLVCYIGDHETDMQCVYNANEELKARNISVRVLSIAACYYNGTDSSSWNPRPDFVAKKVEDILDIVEQVGFR